MDTKVDHKAEALRLIERRDGLRRLCSRDSTNYAQRERLEHRADLKRIEAELEARHA